ncbi:selenocysteine-specific translation elongation factor [Peptostreptococcus faecalis]|uniref:selenocysteine-specific translation elongation factor n=1 Tax=Peptostreptococcus faecalis TaxID=2045015 RepID=UPI000C7B5F12|nr:selenocysteine-specific translation elongation factor [Peptostreptococcus faecalis]
MKHLVIGTAGHIDHGKTSLIKALTGRETDTLDEEKKRGISINLGFTYFDLPSEKRVGIVDVPGHEKFIKNMLAGALGLDMVMLVVAADEGVMPQTVEHIDILSYLNIKKGIIVMTKCDMVDEDMLELAEEDIKDEIKGTFLEGSDVVRVDSISKKGIPELIEKIDTMTEDVEDRNTHLPARMNIDRVFTVKGFGTVVTGTVIEGKINVGDELEVYPSAKKAVVRNIQVHSKDEKTAYAGQRTAINFSNLKMSDVARGDVLAAPDSMLESMMIDVRIKLLNHENSVLKDWDRLKLYHGTREILCRAVPLESEIMNPGEEAYVQLRLEEKIICKKLDPFVVRTYSPIVTIGGGIIVDVADEKHGRNKKTKKIIEELKVKEQGDSQEVLEIYLKNNSKNYPKTSEMTSYVGIDKKELTELLSKLEDEKRVVNINNNIVHIGYFNSMVDHLMQVLNSYHKENNLKIGMPKQEAGLKVEPRFKTKDIDAFLNLVEKNDLIKIVNNLVSIKDFHVELSDKEVKIKNDLNKKIKSLGYKDLYTIETLSEGDTTNKKVIESMIGEEIELLDEDYIISVELYEKARNMVVEFLKKNEAMTLAEFRDMVGSSRKISMLILESFDKKKITKRVENKRVLN